MNTWTPLAGIALLLNAAVWGLSWIPFKALAADGIHPLWATCIIFSLSTLILAASNQGIWRHFKTYPGLLWLLLAAGGTNACFNTAVALGPVIRVILLFYVMPVWAALLARLILKEPITRIGLLEITLGMAGAMMVVYRPDSGLPLPQSLPDWLALAGGFLFALNNIQLKRLQQVPAAIGTQAMVTGAFVLCGLVASVLTAQGIIDTPHLLTAAHRDQSLLTLVLWSFLFLAGNRCLQYGASRLPAALTAVLMLSEVMFGASSAWLLGESTPRWQDAAGGALILTAATVRIVLESLRGQPRAKPL